MSHFDMDGLYIGPEKANESLRAYNQILLSIQGILWMTAQVEGVRAQLHMTEAFMKDQKYRPTAGEMAAEHEAFLQHTADALHVVMEDVGNYMNGHDITSEIDEAVTAPLFEYQP